MSIGIKARFAGRSFILARMASINTKGKVYLHLLRKIVLVLIVFALAMPQIAIRPAEAASGLSTSINTAGGGYLHSLFIAADGAVWAFGDNSAGELGDGTTQNSFRPVQVTKFDGTPLTGAKEVAGGGYYSLALMEDGTVWAWGKGSSGTLGNGAFDDQYRAVQVMQSNGTPIQGVQSIAAGYSHALALKEDGSVWGWGSNSSNVLTDYNDYLIPRAVQLKQSSGSYLTNVKAVGVGDYHSMVLKNDGTVWAWGFGGLSSLGNGSTNSSVYPVQVIDASDQPLADIVGITGHRLGGLALKSDGTVWAWGYNENYNLGIGDGVTSSTKALQVLQTGSVPLTDVAELAGGGRVTVVLKKDGSAWWWGMQNRNLKVATRLINDASQIAAGDNHVLVTKRDGTIWGGGWTSKGELGISNEATYIYYTSPIQVYPATLRMTSNQNRLTADGESKALITVTLLEGSKLPIGKSEGRLQLQATLGELGPVTDHGDGTYSAEFTASTTTGNAVISGTLNGYPMTATTTITLVPLPPSAEKSTVSSSPSSIMADGGSASTITVQLKDANGNSLTSGGHAVKLSATSGTLGTVRNNANGTYTAILTSPTTVGSATVSASVDGVPIRQTATVQFLAGPASADKSTISASANTIPVGTGSTLVTLRLFDAYGNPIASGGNTVKLKSTLGSFGKVSELNNGTFTATLQAGTVSGKATIRAELNGTPIKDQAEVMVEPGAASLSKSTLIPEQPILVADGTSLTQIKLQIRDDYGNDWMASAGQVTMNTTAGVLSKVTDLGNGSYTATLKSEIKVGTAAVSAKLNGAAVTQQAFVEFSPGLASAAGSTFIADRQQVTAGTGEAKLTVQLFDAYGNRLISGGDKVAISADKGQVGNVTDQGNGTYTAAFTAPTSIGNAELSVTVNGSRLPETLTIRIEPGNVSAAASSVEASDSFLTANGVSETTITVHLKDAYGNPVTPGGEQVEISASAGTLTQVEDQGNGIYSAVLTSSTFTGTSTITASVNGQILDHSVHVEFVPGTASDKTSDLMAESAQITANGVSSTSILLQLKDEFGNLLTTGGEQVDLRTTAGTLSSVLDMQDGTYTAILTSDTMAGTAEVTGVLNGVPMVNAAAVQFLPGPPAADQSTLTVDRSVLSTDPGSSAEVTVLLKDAYGNELITDEGAGRLQLAATLGSLTAPVYAGQGRYTAQIQSSQAGNATITAMIDGAMLPTEAEVQFLPGEASPSTSSMVTDTERSTANGIQSAKITLQLTDASGNALTDEAVLPDVQLYSSLGSLSEPEYAGGGKYTAELTSTRAGIAAITATIDGILLDSRVQVEWLPDIPSALASTLTVDRPAVPANGSEHASLELSVRDAYGNAAAGEVRLESTLGTVTEVTYVRPGTYTAELRSTEAGIADIQAWIDGEPVSGKAQVAFTDGIWFSPSSYRIPLGESVRTVVEVTYEDQASDRTDDVDFQYEDGIIQVSQADDGDWYITGLRTGQTVLQAVYAGESGPLTASVPVTVFAVPTRLEFAEPSYSVEEGKRAQVNIVAEYSDGTTKDVTAEAAYAMQDDSIAAIDASGRLLGIRAGTTGLNAEFEGLSASADVKVSAATVPPQPGTGSGENGAGSVTLPTSPSSGSNETNHDPEQMLEFEIQFDETKRELVRLSSEELSSGRIVIDTEEGSRQWSLLTSQAVLNQLRMINDDLIVEWKTPLGTIVLPLSQIGDQDLSDSQEQIRISLREAEGEIQSNVENIASRLGASLHIKPFVLSLETLDRAGNAAPLVSLDLSIMFRTGKAVVQGNKQTTAATLDPITGKLGYVLSQASDDALEFHINPGRLYAVLEVRSSFTDMSGHWAEGAAERLATRLIVQGTGQGKYEPGRAVTRAEIASMLVRMFGSSKQGTSEPFGDASGQWYSSDVQAAYAEGWIHGYADGTFRPEAGVSRQELFVMLARTLESMGYPVKETGAHLPYSDQGSISAWAQSAVRQLTETNLLAGDPSNRLQPLRTVTRAEAAVLLERMMELSSNDQVQAQETGSL